MNQYLSSIYKYLILLVFGARHLLVCQHGVSASQLICHCLSLLSTKIAFGMIFTRPNETTAITCTTNKFHSAKPMPQHPIQWQKSQRGSSRHSCLIIWQNILVVSTVVLMMLPSTAYHVKAWLQHARRPLMVMIQASAWC